MTSQHEMKQESTSQPTALHLHGGTQGMKSYLFPEITFSQGDK